MTLIDFIATFFSGKQIEQKSLSYWTDFNRFVFSFFYCFLFLFVNYYRLTTVYSWTAWTLSETKWDCCSTMENIWKYDTTIKNSWSRTSYPFDLIKISHHSIAANRFGIAFYLISSHSVHIIRVYIYRFLYIYTTKHIYIYISWLVMANIISISSMKLTNPIKELVSKRKKRYTDDGFNLDLSC